MIARALSTQLLSNAIAGGASFLFTLWVARVLGPDHFTEYSFFFSVGSVVAILMAGGYHNLLLRESAKAHDTISEDPARLTGAASGHALIVLTLSLLAANLLFRASAAGLSASLLFFFFLMQGQFISAVLRGKGQFFLESGWSICQRTISVLVPIFYYYLNGRNLGAVAMLVLGAVGLAIPTVGLSRKLGVAGLERPNWQVRAGLLALPFLLTDIGTTLNWRTDVFVLTLLHSDPTETGRYLVAARMYEALVYLAAGPLFVITVQLRKRDAEQDTRFLRTVAAAMTVAVITAGISRLIAPSLIEIFAGASYVTSQGYLKVLLWGLVFQYPASLMLAIGFSGQRAWGYAAIVVVSACFNLTLCRVLVQHYGVVGAAYSNVMTQILLSVALTTYLVFGTMSRRQTVG